ncbi:MAG: MerR family transcriptional regulator [Halanaerobiaceae bacterium]|jgi:DNA-binding transcriptional MerR regulator|nr:MerR family transcriptional regulator [Halanaerobiaceae bacterium]
MEYTVQELARLAGITARTIRYYDEIDLLKPARINSSGYRIYGPKEVDRLQQILFYRELEVSLDKIREILNSPLFDELKALREHRRKLLERKCRLELLIANLDRTIISKERGITMSDQEKFEGFKERMIADNERKYGKEIREKYGDETVDRSYRRLKDMTQEEYEEMARIEEKLMETLQAAFETGNPAGELARQAAELHRQWLSFYWDSYSEEAHAGLAEMYVADERFKSYYDQGQPGRAEFLRDAICIYTGKEKK